MNQEDNLVKIEKLLDSPNPAAVMAAVRQMMTAPMVNGANGDSARASPGKPKKTAWRYSAFVH